MRSTTTTPGGLALLKKLSERIEGVLYGAHDGGCEYARRAQRLLNRAFDLSADIEEFLALNDILLGPDADDDRVISPDVEIRDLTDAQAEEVLRAAP